MFCVDSNEAINVYVILFTSFPKLPPQAFLEQKLSSCHPARPCLLTLRSRLPLVEFYLNQRFLFSPLDFPCVCLCFRSREYCSPAIPKVISTSRKVFSQDFSSMLIEENLSSNTNPCIPACLSYPVIKIETIS